MNHRDFDALTRSLGKTVDRRTTLRALAGGLLATIAGRSALAAQSAEKVDVCHWDNDAGIFVPISVSENALQAHLAHGDKLADAEYGCGCNTFDVWVDARTNVSGAGTALDVGSFAAGDVIQISASGQAQNDPALGFFGPEGNPNEVGLFPFSSLVGTYVSGSRNWNDYFLIGEAETIVMPADGHLYLAVHDNTVIHDNEGGFAVTIKACTPATS